MQFRYYIFCVLLYFAATIGVAAQCTSTLWGNVIDEHDQQPLPYASIYIKELEKGTTSDSLGNYAIPNLCDGTYTIICSHLGCENVEKTVTISGNTLQDFFPEHHSELLKEAVVSIEVLKPRFIMATQSSGIIIGKDLEVTRGKTLGEALKNIVGVNSLQTGTSVSKPIIHGMHSNRVLILNNGVRQEGQQWGSEHAPEIDPFVAGSLIVVKGANLLRYGSDAIGGVIIVDPSPISDSTGIGGQVNVVGFSNGRQGVLSAILEGRFKKLPALSWRVQSTGKMAGNTKTPDYYMKNTGVNEMNFSTEVNYKTGKWGATIFYSRFNTKLGIFSASHIGNLTDLQIAFESPVPLETADFTYRIDRPSQHITHDLVKASAYVNAGNSGYFRFVFARQNNVRSEFDKHAPLNDSLAGLNKPALLFKINTYTTDLSWDKYFAKEISLSIGVNGITQGNEYEGRFFIPNFRNYGVGAFALARRNGEILQLELGVRYDYKWLKVYKWENNVIISPGFKYSNYAASVGGVYRITPKLDFKLNAATAWRPPAVNELFSDGLHHGAASVEVGDRTLKHERAYNFTASLNLELTKKFNGELSAYYNYISDFIYLAPVQPATLTIKGAFPTFHYKQTNATFKGVDAGFDWNIFKGLHLISKGSILRARNISADEYLVMMPADRFENTLKYEFTDGKKVKETYLAVTMLNVLKQWRVPANSDYVAPPEGYTLFGMDAGTEFPMGKQKLSVGAGVNNLLNRVYRDYLNRFRYFSDEAGINFSIRLNYSF